MIFSKIELIKRVNIKRRINILTNKKAEKAYNIKVFQLFYIARKWTKYSICIHKNRI